MDEEAMPFPRDETTPPVVKMNLVLGFATGPLRLSLGVFPENGAKFDRMSLDPNIPKP
jgi:hypothetical protein